MNDDLRAELVHLRAEYAELNDLYTTYRGLVVDGQDITTLIERLRKKANESHAEAERLRTAVLAYDDAIRDVAGPGARWVRDDDKLDDLYAEMICAAGRDINA